MDVKFLLPLTMESFALEPVGIFLFYLTLLLQILEELRQKRPKNGHLNLVPPIYTPSRSKFEMLSVVTHRRKALFWKCFPVFIIFIVWLFNIIIFWITDNSFYRKLKKNPKIFNLLKFHFTYQIIIKLIWNLFWKWEIISSGRGEMKCQRKLKFSQSTITVDVTQFPNMNQFIIR